MTFDPRYAIVTASDSGIGKATAAALAEAGMDVDVTWHSDSNGADATAEEVRSNGRNAVVKELDTDLLSCAVTVDLLIDDLGGLDVSINNAGTGSSTLLSTPRMASGGRSSPPTWFVCMRQAAKHMVKAGNGGRLIAVTSVHECQPRVGSVPTTPPSTASADWSRPSRWSWATTRSPRTPALRARSHPHDWSGGPRSPSGGTARYPTRPARNAREVAAVIAFLASPRAGYATGASWASTAACCRWGPQAGSHLTSDDWRTA
jgi:NAD(P)-dependent dehydrogenase (short-subunit alcohol dehydrogenase family)